MNIFIFFIGLYIFIAMLVYGFATVINNMFHNYWYITVFGTIAIILYYVFKPKPSKWDGKLKGRDRPVGEKTINNVTPLKKKTTTPPQPTVKATPPKKKTTTKKK